MHKVCKVVFNSVSHDARVLKEAKAVKESGFDVTIIGIQDANNNTPIEITENGIVIRRAAWISRAKLRDWEDAPDRVLVGSILSSACYIPDAFPAALALAYRHAGRPADGICSNAQCGGDSCHRGAVVGSLLAATGHFPETFISGLAAADSILPD